MRTYLITRGSQSWMQNGPVFSDIQMLASKHLTDLLLQVGSASQIPQELNAQETCQKQRTD